MAEIINKIDNECSICLEQLTLYPTNKLNCNHIFHTQCIDMWWFHTSNSCPICRKQNMIEMKIQMIELNRVISKYSSKIFINKNGSNM
jgi:hypothetical protein